jgi:hypothetical protein
MVDCDLRDARLCRLGYLRLKVVGKLLAPEGLAGAWKTRDGNELQVRSVTACDVGAVQPKDYYY